VLGFLGTKSEKNNMNEKKGKKSGITVKISEITNNILVKDRRRYSPGRGKV